MEHLPPPHKYIWTAWESDEIREALDKSRAALLNLISDDALELAHRLKLAKVENLFFIDTSDGKITFSSTLLQSEDSMEYGHKKVERAWEWGSKDVMLDLRDVEEQMALYLTAAANLSNGAVYLLMYLTDKEERVWVKALSLAADRGAAPSSLLIQGGRNFSDTPGLLRACKENKGLKHLSLQDMVISDKCIEVLRNFTSLTSLELLFVEVSSEFVVKLAGLHPSHSPLAASLHRLHIRSYKPIDWGRSKGFLRHWPQLKEISLCDAYEDMAEEDLIDFMENLAPSKKEVKTSGSNPESPPKLYSLQLSSRKSAESYVLGRSATAAVVDALSRSGLPFFEYNYRMDPAIQAQLRRNQRDFMAGLDSTRVPATSMRLFICGDPFAGKSTLVSTMRSIYSLRKRDKFMRALFATEGRTRGIEVGAIQREGIRVSLWDMAGQQEFHAFHDCMFPDIGTSSYQFPSMFMFVWSPMESENRKKGMEKTETNFETSFRYWLKFLASKSRLSKITLKVIVVFTRADQMEFVSRSLSRSIYSLQSDFKGVIDIVNPPFEVDARNKDSVKAVAECIFRIAKEMLKGIEVYSICTEVGEHLSNHLKNTNERIITWDNFSEICPIQVSSDKAKMKSIALSLNESGNIIYINKIGHVVLDPNWFCNQIIGSLIGFSNPKASKGTIVFDSGFPPRDFLEGRLESFTGSKGKGSLLVDLMEAMHLCCKLAIDHDVPNSNVDRIFIPVILKDGGVEQLQWKSSTSTCNVDEDYDTFVHMGRRLQCEDQNLTFLTPGLFPRIQVLFNNAFESIKEDNVDIKLGKDFIHICFPDKEIIIVFCKAKSEHVIDVLVRANHPTNSQQCHMPTILAYVEKHVINTLIMICAQPAGIQGVTLIESVIRPDCLRYPSRAQDREDQCIKLAYLKQQLRKKLERDEPKSYDWKQTSLQITGHFKNDFIDLLGSENYEEVLMSCKAWLKEEMENPLLSKNDEVNASRERINQQNVIMTSLDNSLLQEDPISEEAIEVQYSKFMVKAIISRIDRIDHKIDHIHCKIDSNHKELLEKMDAMHNEIQCIRKDVMTKVEKSICKLLKLAMENDVEKQLPRVVILTTNGPNNVPSMVTSLLGALSVQIHLYCEHAALPHPVENQPGITLTSWSESHSKSLHKLLPYINFFFSVLTTAIRLGIKCVAPHASSFLPNWTPHLKLANLIEHPTVSSTIKSKFDRSTSLKISHVCPSTPEYFKEWQKCLEFILAENGGVTDQNIAEKFCLWKAKTDHGTRVSWLCKKHYKEQRFFSVG